MIRAAAFIATVFLLLASGGGRVAAAPASPVATHEAEQQARRAFQSAETHFKAGLFAEALAEYQAGYELMPLPGFLINIAQCHRRLGDLSRAQATYRKFILVAPDSPFVPEVQGLIADLDKLARDLDGDGKTAAEDAPARAALQPLPAAPPPGETTSAPVLVAVATAKPAPHHSGTRWWLWGTLGVVVAAAATTALVVLDKPGTTTLHDGTLGTLRR